MQPILRLSLRALRRTPKMQITSDLFALDRVHPISKFQAGAIPGYSLNVIKPSLKELASTIQLLGGAEASWQLVQRIGNITTYSTLHTMPLGNELPGNSPPLLFPLNHEAFPANQVREFFCLR